MAFQQELKRMLKRQKLIEQGDALANYAHFALQKLRILPSQFMELDQAEKAFVIASIDLRVKAEEEASRKAKNSEVIIWVQFKQALNCMTECQDR